MLWFDRSARDVVVGCALCGARDVGSPAYVDAWAVDHLDGHVTLEDANRVDLDRAVASLQERSRRHA